MDNFTPLSKEESKSDPLFISSLVSAFQVLELFAGDHAELSMKQIRDATGLTFQTIQRITNSLERCGYLQRDERTKAFRLALKTLDMQYRFLASDRVVKVAWPVLVGLREQTRQRVSICTLDGTDIFYLQRVTGYSSDFKDSLIGHRLPAFCTAGGRAILACLPQAEREAVLDASELKPMTPKTIIDRNELLRVISECERQGYCVTEEETRLGETNAAVAIIGPGRKVLGAVVIAAPAKSHPVERMREEMVPLVRDAARAIASG